MEAIYKGLAVVSGASRGIGLAISRAFLREGLDVLGVAQDIGSIGAYEEGYRVRWVDKGAFVNACSRFIYFQGGVAHRGICEWRR